ncbi:ABC transporter ATP-binding protein [Palleronia caenipelagi]|uniref:ABC transporter ATP-binding protein n=2 Tax=Palleronia caenipelagi TaxID=2489174 RepID=A0A547PR66_9RHOB|nr:ABC transporter ATP-binding protein [Palleronia caenipelagi]
MKLTRDEDRARMLQRLFVDHAAGQRKYYAIAVVAMVVVAATTALTAFLMEYIVDAMTQYEDKRLVMAVAIAVAATFSLKGFANYVQSVAMSRAGNRIIAAQQEQLYGKLLRHGVSFFTAQESSHILTRITSGAAAANKVIEMLVTSVSRDLLMLIGLVGVMIYQEPVLSMFALLVGPAAIFGVRKLLKQVREIMQGEMVSTAEITRVIQETSKGIQVVKVFALEDRMQERMDRAVRSVEGRRNAMARLNAVTSPLMETLSGFAIAGIIAVSAFNLSGSEDTTPGQLMSFITAFMMAYEPAKRLSKIRVRLEGAMVRVRLMFELLDYDEQLVEAPDAEPLTKGPGEVRLDHVSFAYREGKQVITDLNVTMPAGKMTALVGPSGGGKSTIFNLILRLYDPTEGRVLIDGQDIRGATFASLRDKVSYVGQDTFLFSTTVRENIRFSRPDATDEEVEQAARDANAHDFIVELDQGYETPVGENGIFLSGGQRQRLSIARAILRRSELLLLDEATSALDSSSELLVKEALARLTKDVTTIVIAHRLSTVLEAEQILVLAEGQVIEKGTAPELLRNEDGMFRLLYDQQMDGGSDYTPEEGS